RGLPCLGRAEMVRVRPHADSAKVEPVRVPASANGPVPVVRGARTVPARDRGKRLLLARDRQQPVIKLRDHQRRARTVPRGRAVGAALNVMKKGEQRDHGRDGAVPAGESQPVMAYSRPVGGAMESVPLESEFGPEIRNELRGDQLSRSHSGSPILWQGLLTGFSD